MTPRTEAGRALMERREDDTGVSWTDAAAILAIEAEAVSAWLASPEAAEELAVALPIHRYDDTGDHKHCLAVARATLIALREGR